MVDISVALWEYHQDHFQPGELSRIEKRVLLCQAKRPAEVLGISYEGQEGVQYGGHAEGAEGE